MKKTILLLLFVEILFGSTAYAQSNKTTITYRLTKTFTSGSLAAVGGDLVIPDGQPTTTRIPICKPEVENVQTLYKGSSLAAVFVDVSNEAGNGCVTLVVTTETGTVKETISSSSQSGLRKFLKVKKMELVIDHSTSTTFPQTVEAIGSAEIWF